MAIDTQSKRRSAYNYAGPFTGLPPVPDGSVNEFDRKQLALIYAGQLVSQVLFELRVPAGVSILFLVGDPTGRVLTEIQPEIRRISWRQSGIGTTSFIMARTDPKLRREFFTEGNRVLLQFDNGLPPWGGIITGASEWTDTSVQFEAFSGEWLLTTRLTGRNAVFAEAQIGTILAQLIDEAESYYPLGLRLGQVWQGGDGFSPVYHWKSLYDVLSDDLIASLGGGAFDVLPEYEGGRIGFVLNLYERRGADKPNLGLVEGVNISGVRFRTTDEVVNVWRLAGDGDGWDEASRPYATARNEESVSRHGLREAAYVATGVTQQSMLDEIAANRLAATAWPSRVLALSVRNAPPARFSDYDLGDALRCRLPSFGFEGVDAMFALRAREFFPDSGTADLVLEELAS